MLMVAAAWFQIFCSKQLSWKTLMCSLNQHDTLKTMFHQLSCLFDKTEPTVSYYFRFNITNLCFHFFVHFLGVIACGTKSDSLSPSSLSLPLSVAKCCCRFFLNVLPADSFFCFPLGDLVCLSTEPTSNKKL